MAISGVITSFAKKHSPFFLTKLCGGAADFYIKKTDSPFVIISVPRHEINFGKIANIEIF